MPEHVPPNVFIKINLFKPLGIMSLLEEECIVPKATDMSYRDKLFHQHIGKSAALGKVKKQTKFEAHFEIYHYAGTVGYNVTDWLLKNKDPLNGSLIEIFKRSENIVFQKVWESYVGADDQKSGGKGLKFTKLQNFHYILYSHFPEYAGPTTKNTLRSLHRAGKIRKV